MSWVCYWFSLILLGSFLNNKVVWTLGFPLSIDQYSKFDAHTLHKFMKALIIVFLNRQAKKFFHEKKVRSYTSQKIIYRFSKTRQDNLKVKKYCFNLQQNSFCEKLTCTLDHYLVPNFQFPKNKRKQLMWWTPFWK